MLERSEKPLRILCIALAAVLLLEVGLKLVSRSPLSGVKIPALPTVSTEADSSSSGKGTNAAPGKAAEVQAGNKGTNSLAAGQTNALGTNLVSKSATTQDVHSVHRSARKKGDTNLVAAPKASSAETNTAASPSAIRQGTNGLAESKAPASGSNTVAQVESSGSSTNSARSKASGKGTNSTGRVETAMNSTNPSARPGMGKRAPDLPLPILARVDRVVDSELFGPVFHPMPAGLLGIAGNVAFLRSSNGQTGAIKEGDELGGLKLLRIGINRVLIEEDGQKKELMIFSGLGGQSLLPN
jgi:hypothetical protein